MSKNLFLMLACVLVLAFGLQAQEKREQKALKNSDIVQLSQNHIDDTLMKLIQVSATDFDVSGPSLLEMKKQGVRPLVLRAMVEAKLKADSARASTIPIPDGASPSTTDSASAEERSPISIDKEQCRQW